METYEKYFGGRDWLYLVGNKSCIVLINELPQWKGLKEA